MVKKKDVPSAAIAAALDLAEQRGWAQVTLADVAAEAKIPLIELFEQFGDRGGILRAYLRQIDEAMLRVDEEGPQGSARDSLFDMTMRRFEAMRRHKAAIRAIMRDTRDPAVGFCAGIRLLRTARLMLEAAGVPTGGLRGVARVHGMAALYVYAFGVWMRDESEDLSATMAALDKALRRAESLASMAGGRRRFGAGDAADAVA
jgi:ubiquinone biosynthesis protein COQ9